ncbi:hypothetical protein BDW74DRAFT_175573 [Aspergillus multicolor]|uniref:uncharacterized protein n=1 Tax=Aspergillus multicolor TaxID=41759 RepID=UPI003CCD07BB
MGIELDVQGLDSERTFHPGEAVAGSVLLRLDRSTVISGITVCIEGSVSTSLVEKGSPFVLGNDVPAVAEENHQLFSTSEIVFPPPGIPELSREYTLPKAEYTFPFSISFPRVVDSSGLPLPPSFSVHSEKHRAAADIMYELSVELTRPGRLRRRISVYRQLQFRPSNTGSQLSPSGSSEFHVGQAALHVDASTRYPADIGFPVLILEGTLCSPPVAYAATKLPLSLRIRRLPVHTEYIIPVKMRSITLTLRSKTTIKAGTHHASWVSSQNLLSLDGLDEDCRCYPGVESFTDLSPQLLDDAVVPEDVPGFKLGIVEQKYSLDVEGGFALGDARKEIRFAIDLEVPSGPRTEVGEHSSVRVVGRPGFLSPSWFDGIREGAGREPLPCYSPSMI